MKKRHLALLTALLLLLGGCGGQEPPANGSEQNMSAPPVLEAMGASKTPLPTQELGPSEEPEPSKEPEDDWPGLGTYIMHGGGELDGNRTSNSREALDQVLASGQYTVEVDFCWTSDGELVCIHDYNGNYNKLFEERQPVALDEFMSLRIYGRYTPLCLETLVEWLLAHPEMTVVTDIKENNLAALEKLAVDHPEALDRFVPQIYHPDEYEPVAALGFEHIIYTIYNLSEEGQQDTEAIVRFAREHPLAAVTFPVWRVTAPKGEDERDPYVDALLAADTPLYIHTVNDWEDVEWYRFLGLSGVYTDCFFEE